MLRLPRSPRALAGSALVGALILTTLVGHGDTASPAPLAAPAPPPEASATPTPTPSATFEGDPAPLTGIPTTDADLLARRLVAVKIDNHVKARPQTGINQADGVMELIVESGLTRFIALFHTSDLDEVGPVRSGRPTDPTIVRPLQATLLISGAQPWIINLIRNTGVPLFVDIGEDVTFRSRARYAPHNLYGNTVALRGAAAARGIDDSPPPAWFARPNDLRGKSSDGTPTTQASLQWSEETNVTWDLFDGRWFRTINGVSSMTIEPDGTQARIEADHLVVLGARRYTARSPVDGGGLPALDTVGNGAAWVLIGGDNPRVLEGTWSRDQVSDLPVLVDQHGAEIVIPVGRLWVSWFPSNRTPVFS
ncbi:MAG: hypothetical protein ACI867_000500 [Glaciecola sp.]|jgi:hypothetical protein